MTPTIPLQKLCDIPPAPDRYSLVRRSVANDGSLLFLAAEPGGPKRFHLAVVRPNGSLQTIELPEVDLSFPLVDIFPSGKVLLVGRRCDWHDDLNGAVFDPKTASVSRILLGDGIERTYVDALGRIWVSYFDEGIFGGGGGPGPTPIGAAGLICFSEAGERLWEYPEDDGMADCYALNVWNSEAVIFFYTDFPLCRITSDFKLAYWKPGLSGCHEFAISDNEVLFSGQYHDSADTAYLGRFETVETLATRRVRLTLPDGSPVPRGQLLGRGKHLYFFDTSAAYRASLD
jgi:hypothetical protein